MTGRSGVRVPADRSEWRYVGFGVRFVAFVVDSIVAFIAITPPLALVLGNLPSPLDIDMNDPAALAAYQAAVLTHTSVNTAIVAALFVTFWILRAATPGKMLFRAVIVDAQTGAKPTLVQSLIRYFMYYPGLFAFGLGFLWIVFDERHQGWHDKLAGTVVIREAEKSPDQNSQAGV